MQDRYAGDVGDFGKLGLLRQIADSGLRIGINWYRTCKAEEQDRGDGRHTGYLNNRLFQDYDDHLLKNLAIIAGGNRSIAALEKAKLIPHARYYSELLKPGSDRLFSRYKWYRGSLEALGDSDIIFCDPDNGLQVKSVSPNSSKSDKYVQQNELVAYYLLGKSVIFYNHRCREKEQTYLRRFSSLQARNELSTAKWLGLKFARGSIRDYIFILQSCHFEKVGDVIENMMRSNWDKHFSVLNI